MLQVSHSKRNILFDWNNFKLNKMTLFMMNPNTHLGYWCTSGVCRCTDSPSSYCRVKANKGFLAARK